MSASTTTAPTSLSEDPLQGALSRFGLQAFRQGQREVIESIVSGNDCMCVMPTGGGKSLCYQLPSVVRPGLTIVVSPLIALMKDQVDALAKLGIPAALINSTLSASEQSQRLQDVAAGKYQMVYVAPERLRNSRFQEAIRATPIQLLAIDEAHCISQWGHDFRPDYTRIGKFREWLGGVQTVALTATATPRVREDIVEVLGLKRPKQFMSGFARPNLHFGVVQTSNDREKADQLEGFLNKLRCGAVPEERDSGIIYSATRKRCDELVATIQAKTKIPVGAYHAGLMPDQRRAIQERFMKNELQVIVATNAFGMGIDKPDLRFVIHYNMPGSLEAYYQEAGRAGRDGKQSQCVMLYSFQDRYIQEFFIDNNYPSRDIIRTVYNFLADREEDPIELTLEEIRDRAGLSVSPESVGSALQILQRTRVLDRLDRGGGLAMVRLNSNLPNVVDVVPRDAKRRRQVMRLVERAVGDRRYEQVFVHPRWLLQESGLERDVLSRTLRELCKLDEFDYVPPFRGRAVHFNRQGVAFDDLGIDFDNLQERKDAEYDRLNQVVNYAQSPLCRQVTILKYFGDTSAKSCTQCDRCERQPGWPKFAVADQDAKVRSDSSVKSSDSSAAATQTQVQLPTGVKPGSEIKTGAAASSSQVQLLVEVVEAIKRTHGRLGKHLISQFLCGSQNAKIQKLNLHRLDGFGLLTKARQADAVALLDLLLAAGALKQQEVNRNRPTIAVAGELVDASFRDELLGGIEIPRKLQVKLLSSTQLSASSVSQTGVERGSKEAAARQSQSNAPSQAVSSPIMLKQSEQVDTPAARTHEGASVSSDVQPAADDWKWTMKLFEASHSWADVLAIRRMTDAELADSLCYALRAGVKIRRQWLDPVDDELRSSGQQRVLREMRRRAAAGVR